VKSILTVPHHALRQAVAGRTLLVFDLDGTLIPIAARPEAARLQRSTRRLLAQVTQRYPTVVLTGRDRADAARTLRGVGLKMIVGNHGLDLGGGKASKIVAAWAFQLRQQRTALRGVTVERKRLSITTHYRGVPNPAAARRRVMRVVKELLPVPRIIPGKESVNLLPDIGLNKGTALRHLIRYFRARAAVYVGDDATDEDAFAAAKAYAVLTVRVGRSAQTAARFSLPAQAQIDDFLVRLMEVGEPPRRFATAAAARNGGTAR
jgi:trehalose 6-phosphate phosphatase